MNEINVYLAMCEENHKEGRETLQKALAEGQQLGDFLDGKFFRQEHLAYLADAARRSIERGDLAEWLESLHKRIMDQALNWVYNSGNMMDNVSKELRLNAMVEFYGTMVKLLKES